jgi:hypothetical protein
MLKLPRRVGGGRLVEMADRVVNFDGGAGHDGAGWIEDGAADRSRITAGLGVKREGQRSKRKSSMEAAEATSYKKPA